MISNVISINRTIEGDIFDRLKYTPVRTVYPNGSYSIEYVSDEYYIRNDSWELTHFFELPQFAKEREQKAFANNKRKGGETGYINYKLTFDFRNERLNKETKLIFHQMIFNELWTLNTAFLGKHPFLSALKRYLNEQCPQICSYHEMDDQGFMKGYQKWLLKNDYKLTVASSKEGKHRNGAKRRVSNGVLRVPLLMCEKLASIESDDAETANPNMLWKSDIWDPRNFKVFGIDYVKTRGSQTIRFVGYKNESLKNIAKRYLKDKLLSRSIVWSTALSRTLVIRDFSNFMDIIHPNVRDYRDFERDDVVKLAEQLHIKGATVSDDPSNYVKRNMSTIRTFLMDIQDYEYEEAPCKDVARLITRDYTKGGTRISDENKIKRIPNYVLKQLLDNFDGLAKKWQVVVLMMYYTGLRISDVLEIPYDCLEVIDGKNFVQVDVRKTKISNHMIPIPDDFAVILKRAIEEAMDVSNDYSNPDRLLFVHYTGMNRGNPYSCGSVSDALNNLALQRHIVDEKGNLYHFKNHAFRHTYAMEMLNNGASIITVQELLGHLSPTMTMTYARLVDDVKYREFTEAIKNGAFSFGGDSGSEIVIDAQTEESVLKALWNNHKLHAVDTPYGTCLQRKNGNCKFGKQPPCLTCNDGAPCKDLCIGAFEGDSNKYRILIESTSQLCELAKNNSREDMAKENEELLTLLKGIKDVIDDGGIIYGRRDRMEVPE